MKTAASTQGTRSGGQRIAIVAAAILQVLATFLPSLGVGEPIGERSDAARTLITPAGWAFSIWGPLFAGCLAYAVYQFLESQRDNGLLDRIGWASAGAFLGNAAWAVYTQSLALNLGSALIILFTLLCLLRIYRAFAEAPRPFTRGERWLAVLPLSALAAWLTAAAIVNIAATLRYHGVEAGAASPLVAAAIVLAGGLIAAAALWRGRGNPWYALVFLWALAAIHAGGGREHDEIALAVIVAAFAVVAAALARLSRPPDRGHWFAAAL